MNTEKKILYFDMDNVLVDFQSGIDRLSDETKKEFTGLLPLSEPGFAGLKDLQDWDNEHSRLRNPVTSKILKIPVQTNSMKRIKTTAKAQWSRRPLQKRGKTCEAMRAGRKYW
jgi:FMN phosphatase YigB (HAD superfamily)